MDPTRCVLELLQYAVREMPSTICGTVTYTTTIGELKRRTLSSCVFAIVDVFDTVTDGAPISINGRIAADGLQSLVKHLFPGSVARDVTVRDCDSFVTELRRYALHLNVTASTTPGVVKAFVNGATDVVTKGANAVADTSYWAADYTWYNVYRGVACLVVLAITAGLVYGLCCRPAATKSKKSTAPQKQNTGWLTRIKRFIGIAKWIGNPSWQTGCAILGMCKRACTRCQATTTTTTTGTGATQQTVAQGQNTPLLPNQPGATQQTATRGRRNTAPQSTGAARSLSRTRTQTQQQQPPPDTPADVRQSTRTRARSRGRAR